MVQTSVPPPTSSQASVERRLRVLILGQELRVEQLELILADERDMKLSSLVDLTSVDSTFALVQRQNKTQRVDVVLIDWDGDSADNMQLLKSLSSAGLRCLALTWQVMPSDIAAYRQAGAWGCVSTRASSRHLLIALRHVAQGKLSFPPAVVLATDQRAPRQLMFYPEVLQDVAHMVGHQLSPTEFRIFERLNEADAVEIARSLDLEPGTIRTELSTNIFRILREYTGKKIKNQKQAFQEALSLRIFAYQ